MIVSFFKRIEKLELEKRNELFLVETILFWDHDC